MVRRISSSRLPEPTQIPEEKWESWFGGKPAAISSLDSCLVSISGEFIGFDKLGATMLVKLVNDTIPISFTEDFGKLSGMDPGSVVEVMGICKVTLSYGAPSYDYPHPNSIRILAQDASSVRIVSKAPWWTAFRLWVALGIGTVILSLALGWNFYLQGNKALKNAALIHVDQKRRQSEIEFAATLRERQRLASDIHDGVEQSLAGVAYQIETLDFHEPGEEGFPEQLDKVRQSLAKLREQLRRIVWNMHSMMFSGGDLPRAMGKMASRAIAASKVQIRHEVHGKDTRVGDFTASQILFVAQELVSNAIKHGRPDTVAITLDFRDEEFELIVSDDGRGFDPVSAPSVAEGHFGVQGIRERIKRIGGTVTWESGCEGTTVSVQLPYG